MEPTVNDVHLGGDGGTADNLTDAEFTAMLRRLLAYLDRGIYEESPGLQIGASLSLNQLVGTMSNLQLDASTGDTEKTLVGSFMGVVRKVNQLGN